MQLWDLSPLPPAPPAKTCLPKYTFNVWWHPVVPDRQSQFALHLQPPAASGMLHLLHLPGPATPVAQYVITAGCQVGGTLWNQSCDVSMKRPTSSKFCQKTSWI